jgi:hypothetical protein
MEVQKAVSHDIPLIEDRVAQSGVDDALNVAPLASLARGTLRQELAFDLAIVSLLVRAGKGEAAFGQRACRTFCFRQAAQDVIRRFAEAV